MHAVIRTYNAEPALAEQLAKRGTEVQAVVQKAKGFIAYYLLKTGDGIASVTVCNDVAGTEESTRLAADWLKANLPAISIRSLVVTTGPVALSFAATPATIRA